MADLATQEIAGVPPVKPRRKTVSTRVDDDMYNRLKKLSFDSGKTIDEVVRTMIKYALKKLSEN